MTARRIVKTKRKSTARARAVAGPTEYRSPATDGLGRYPEWLRELQGKSGVYVIRERGGGDVLYIGESHDGNLYDTLTRHFQQWRRAKRYWDGLRGKHDPGLTYNRDRVEVSVRHVRAGDADRAIDEQYKLIQKLKPRDNIVTGETVTGPPPKKGEAY